VAVFHHLPLELLGAGYFGIVRQGYTIYSAINVNTMNRKLYVFVVLFATEERKERRQPSIPGRPQNREEDEFRAGGWGTEKRHLLVLYR
jgi:hypothetical protein